MNNINIPLILKKDIKPEDIMSDNEDIYKGHRKGTTSAFFINVEYALYVIPKNEYEKKRVIACEKMMRYQIPDIVKSNSIGILYNFRDNKLKQIFHEEMAKHINNKIQNKKVEITFNNDKMRGFIGDDFLPQKKNFGIANNKDINDPLLARNLKRQKGVRKGTMGAFNENYKLLKKNPNNTNAINRMKELLPNIIKLDYFKWIECNDIWIQKLIDDAYTDYKEIED